MTSEALETEDLGATASGDQARAAGGDAASDALELVIAVHRLVRSLRRASSNRGYSSTQLVVLTYLKDVGSARIGEIAAYVPCSQPTATTVVNGLQDSGLVDRVPDEADRRATLVTITKLGLAAVRAVAESRASALSRRLDTLDDHSRDLVRELIPLLTALADAPGEDQPGEGSP